jgi:hypothetical protein
MTFQLKKTGRALALTSALVAAVSLSVIPATAEAAWRGGGGHFRGGGHFHGGGAALGFGLAAGALAGAAIASSPYYYGYGYPYYASPYPYGYYGY